MAGFDDNNYVAATGNPSAPYVAVVNGKATPFSSQGEAEQAYNAMTGQGGQISAPSAPGKVSTREGPRSMEEVRQGIIAAGGSPTGDDAQDLAMFNNAGGGGGGGSGGSGGGDDGGYIGLGGADISLRSMLGLGDLALRRDIYGNIQLPGFQFQKQFQTRQLDTSIDQFNRELALRKEIADADRDYRAGLLTDQQHKTRVSEALGRGDLALRGYGQAGQEALSREQLAQQGFFGADAAALARQRLGLEAGQYADQAGLDRSRLALSAAEQADRGALARAQLVASLRGPADAFKQQEVLGFLGRDGALGDILSGTRAAPSFQAPQARPVAANLDTLANQMDGLPVDAERGYATGPSDIAMGLAREYAAPGRSEGAELALGAARGLAADPYGAGAREALAQAGRNADDPYGSPTAGGALVSAAPNAAFATPGSPLADTNAVAARAIGSYKAMGANAPTGPTPEGIAFWQRQVPGLDPTGAAALAGRLRDISLSGRAPSEADVAQTIGQVLSERAVRGVNAPVGLGQRLESGYEYLDRTGQVSPTTARELYQNLAGMSPLEAQGQLAANGAVYRSSGQVYGPQTQASTLYQAPPAPSIAREDWAGRLDQLYQQQKAANGGAEPTPEQLTGMYRQIGLSPEAAEEGRHFGGASYRRTGGGDAHKQAVNDWVFSKLNQQAANTPRTAPVDPRPIYRAPGPGEWGEFAPGRMYHQRHAAPGSSNPLDGGGGSVPGSGPALWSAQPPAEPRMAPIDPRPTPIGGGMTVGAAPRNPDSQGATPPRGYAAPSRGAAASLLTGQGPQQPAYSAPSRPNPAAAALAQIPDPQQIAGRNFFKAPKSTQQFVLGGLEAKGYDRDDALHTIQQAMPKSYGPRIGRIAA